MVFAFLKFLNPLWGHYPRGDPTAGKLESSLYITNHTWIYEWIRNGTGISLMIPEGFVCRLNVIMRKRIIYAQSY